MLHSIWNFFCNLFIFKEFQRQIQMQKKTHARTYDMHIQFYAIQTKEI